MRQIDAPVNMIMCVCVYVCVCVCRVVLAGFYQSTICMKWLRCASTDMCNERLFLSLCAVHLEGHSHPPAHPLLPRHTIKPAKCGEFFCVWVCVCVCLCTVHKVEISSLPQCLNHSKNHSPFLQTPRKPLLQNP